MPKDVSGEGTGNAPRSVRPFSRPGAPVVHRIGQILRTGLGALSLLALGRAVLYVLVGHGVSASRFGSKRRGPRGAFRLASLARHPSLEHPLVQLNGVKQYAAAYLDVGNAPLGHKPVNCPAGETQKPSCLSNRQVLLFFHGQNLQLAALQAGHRRLIRADYSQILTAQGIALAELFSTSEFKPIDHVGACTIDVSCQVLRRTHSPSASMTRLFFAGQTPRG